jgi:hypothetical protein
MTLQPETNFKIELIKPDYIDKNFTVGIDYLKKKIIVNKSFSKDEIDKLVRNSAAKILLTTRSWV